MAFGTELQGKSSHEALLRLQDFEIRLLENVKKCVAQRVKIDREYSASLAALVGTATKIDAGEFVSPFCQVWTNVAKETEHLARLVQENADQLFVNTLEKLIQIIGEKKAVRRLYQDERNRIDADLNRLQEEVGRFAADYERCLAKLQQNRTKYEETAKRVRTGAKYEDARNKYVRSETKVHNLHNEYVVALRELNIHGNHYASVVLPSLLEFQQKVQENVVDECKTSLIEYGELTDCTSAKFQNVHRAIRSCVESMNPKAEYKEFVVRHRTEPAKYARAEFGAVAGGDSSSEGWRRSSPLNEDEILVDELTIDPVRQRLTASNDQVDKCRLRLESKKQELGDVEATLAKPDRNNPTNARLLTLKRSSENLKREILELQCTEEKLLSTSRLLKESLDRLGDARPASGLTTVVVDLDVAYDDDGDIDRDAATSVVGSGSVKLSNTMNTVRKTLSSIRPFKKSHPSIIPPCSTPPIVANNSSIDGLRPGVGEDAAAASAADCLTASEKPGSDGYQMYNFAPYKGVDAPGTAERPLEEEEWYHGVLPRDEVQRLLVDDGDYLVRASRNKKTAETQYVLSVMWSTHKHFIIQENDGGFRFEGDTHPTVQELIARQHRCGQPVTRKSEAVLRAAVRRPDWELRNDDIALSEKIGSGQFGEVFRGVHRVTGASVAVKTCRETLGDDVKSKFLQEGRILKQYDHPNIVRFIGIAAQRHPVMIVMEFVPGGALLTFLRKHGARQTARTLVRMCADAAAGMAYLESKNCLHRDLAARNCLVGADNAVKISDFGMSREEEEYVVSGGLKQIPIKWTAPEALNYGTYTTACDVWSYGILVWEVFSYGATPYPGLTNAQARDKVDEGYRMPPPEGTPAGIYEIMTRCWEQEARSRMRFSEISQTLQTIHGSFSA